MNLPKLTKTALVATLAGTLGLVATVPATFAQDAGPNAGPKRPAAQDVQRPGQWRQHNNMRFNAQRPEGSRGIIDLLGTPRGAEALEIAFVRLSHRIDLTDTQKPLFEDLKTTALAAQSSFADAAKAARESLTANNQRPDLVTGLKARVAVDTARLEAINTVLPKLEAFMNSLSDQQKADLMPRRGHVGIRGQGMGNPNMGPGQHQHNGGMRALPQTAPDNGADSDDGGDTPAAPRG